MKPGMKPMSLTFKSATLYALRLVLQQADTSALLSALNQRMRDAGSFFQQEPVVIDASALDAVVDWTALIDALRAHQLPPVGVVAQGDNLQAAIAAGLASVELSAAPVRPRAVLEDAAPPSVIPASVAAASVSAASAASTASPSCTSPATESSAATPVTPAVAPAAMVVRRQLRSGQRIYARDTDLIIIGVVGHGAEVIADGNIHVYGPLRGKAMAGARGDASARIFALQLDPELLAIAGIYRVLETRLDAGLHNQACIVHLENETLNIARMMP